MCGLPSCELGPCGGELFTVKIETTKVGLVFGHRTTSDPNAEATARLTSSMTPSSSFDHSDVSGGAVVLEVAHGSAAEAAGVRAGDRLHRIQGSDVPLKKMSTYTFHMVGKNKDEILLLFSTFSLSLSCLLCLISCLSIVPRSVMSQVIVHASP